MNDRPIKDVERIHYDEQYAYGSAETLKTDVARFIHEEFELLRWKSDRNRFAFSLIHRTRLPNQAVLDHACGTGRWAVFLALLGARTVVGFDLSPRAIAVARRRAEVNGVENRVRFVVGSADSIPFESDSFDFVWAPAALHHTIKHPGA